MQLGYVSMSCQLCRGESQVSEEGRLAREANVHCLIAVQRGILISPRAPFLPFFDPTQPKEQVIDFSAASAVVCNFT